MNCLSRYSGATHLKTNRGIISIFIILLVFLSALGGFQSNSYPQNPQWRVFTIQNSQLPTNLISRIVIDRNNVKWIGTAAGMVRIVGNNWYIYDSTNTPFENSGIFPETFDSSNNLWVSVAYNGIAKFNGVNWIIYDTTNSGLPSNSVPDIKVDENNIKWVATNKGIARFDDTLWTIYNTTNSGLPVNSTTTIAIENEVKWIGTFSLYGGMAKFNDTNWVVYNTTNSGIPSNAIWDIKIDNWGIKWIGTHFGGVGRYNSIQNNWIIYSPMNSGLPDAYVYCVLTENNIKWFGTQGGGLARFDDSNWVVFDPSNSPLPSYSILGLGLDSNRNVWICTAGGLVVYNESGIIGLNSQSKNTPKEFILYQNYPNPFNPKTNIKFKIPKYDNVVISIYDLMGKKITTLLNKKVEAGIHKVQWDGSNYPSGVYLYRLESRDPSASSGQGFVSTRKMVLIK